MDREERRRIQRDVHDYGFNQAAKAYHREHPEMSGREVVDKVKRATD